MRRAFLVVAAFLLSACGPSQADDSMTESDAYDQVEVYIRGVATALPADAHLESAEPPSSVACKGRPAGRVMVVSTYFVRGMTYSDKPVDTMLHWWEAHDFALLDDLRPQRHYVWVQNKTDKFRMSLHDNDTGEVLLTAQSPCLAAG